MSGFLRLVLSLGKDDQVVEFGVSLKRGEANQLIDLLKGQPRKLMSRAMQGEFLDSEELTELQDAIAEAVLTLRARAKK